MSTLDLPKGITAVTEHGLPAYRIDTPLCSGLVYEHGAHVASWVPAGHDDVLWLSPDSEYSATTAIRGGVPICFPWFGPGRTGNRTPKHGFARLSDWYLVGASVERGTANISLELTGDEVSDLGGFPADFTIRLDVSMGSRLSLALTVTAGETALDFEEALHTYFRVDDVRGARVEGLGGVDYLDKVRGGTRAQSGAITFTEQTDRIYLASPTTRLVDGDRAVVVAPHTSADTVVWNPWDEVAATMTDFTTNLWPTMACVETVNCLDDAVTLDAGQCHTMGVEITVA